MKRKHFLFIGIIIILIPYLFWLYLGEDSYVLIHDNLDSEFVYIQMLLDSGNLFGFDFSGEIPQLMNGLDRSFLRSGFSLTFLIFAAFPPIYAYILHHMVVHVIAFFGMFLLLERFVITNNKLLVTAISLCFGFLSFYHVQYGVSIAGQPLLLWSFLNFLYKRNRWYDWVNVILFPFFSFLVVTLPFFLPILVGIGILFDVKRKSISYLYYCIIFLLIIISMAVEYNLLRVLFIDNNELTHRVEWNKFEIIGYPDWDVFWDALKKNLKVTQYHVGYIYTLGIYLALIYTLVFNKTWLENRINYVVALILLFAIWYAGNGFFVEAFRDSMSIINTFNSGRVYFMLPLLWLLLLAMILKELNWNVFWHKLMALSFIAFVFIGGLRKNQELTANYRILLGRSINLPTYRQFFNEHLISKLKERHLSPISQYRVVSVGIHPQIALYNGLFTLDAYQNNYSLSYKHDFRKIIADELEKDESLKKYYDYWGSRCYIFSAELGKDYLISKSENKSIENLNIDIQELKNLGGTHIMSAVPINNYKFLQLELQDSVTSKSSFYNLYLYKVE